MTLPANHIAQMLGIESTSTTPISTLLTDSRDLAFAGETVFFALRTAGNDGHNFIKELYDRGVRHFVVDEDAQAISQQAPDAEIWHVPNVLEALQHIGQQVRLQADGMPVIGITGSRGKTIVKELLNQMLAPYFTIARSPRSYNSQIGVPLSLWGIEAGTTLGIFEAGISEPGEMGKIESMMKPQIGIFTSLTDEHGEGFDNIEHKAAEKAKLFRGSKHVFYPEHDTRIKVALESECPGAELHPCAADNYDMALEVARLVAKTYAGVELDAAAINPRLAATSSSLVSRFDVVETLKDCQIVYDGFTLDDRSTLDALNFLARRITPGLTATAVLGYPEQQLDIDKLALTLDAKDVRRLITVGFPTEAIDRLKALTHAKIESVDTVQQFIDIYTISDFDSEAILVKGAPGQGFEDIKNLLEGPRHETVMEVDLGAIARNFNFYRSLVHPGTGLVAMVKAAGYGVGSLELAKTLQMQGAAYLAVAVIDEGIELRRAGITMPIMVMNPISTNYKALFDYKLEPSVFSLRELNLLIDNARRIGVKDYPVHIKLDTGMHRVGFIADELPELITALKAQEQVKAESIFSHLATADCLDQDAYTLGQLQAFESMSSQIISGLGHKVKRHILNTAGIMRYPEYQYDMVRLGIGLYGVSPVPMDAISPASHPARPKLDVVAKLFTTIISLKHWGPGTTIGYGRRGVITQDAVIATIPIGYADGLDRHLSRGAASVLVNGKMCPIVGNICMDQCMIDVTGANAKIGDKVEIFGENAPVERLSDTLETIPYEILTSISPRVKRIYYRD